MTIQNGLGITGYSRTMDKGIPGSRAEFGEIVARPMVNPKNKQVTELTAGGTASDGDYTVTITEPDGTVHTVTFTRASAETNDGISDGLVTAFETAITGDLAGVVESAVDSDTNDLQITFAHEGLDYTVATSAPGSGTLTATEITDPAGSSIPLGRFVADGGASEDGQRAMALPSGVAETAVLGVLMRPIGMNTNQEGTLSSDVDEVQAGGLGDVCRRGAVNVLNVGGDATANGSVFVVVNTAGGDALGAARGTDDGANSVELPARAAYWVEDTPEGEVGAVYLTL